MSEREQFEAALQQKPDARFWNTTDAMYWAWQQARATSAQAEAVPQRPDIIEKLTYHARERDDMTLDDCLSYLSTNGWHKVRGRTEREIVLQLTALLAAAPAVQQPRGDITAAVDAAMEEMQNIHPTLRRSECERLIWAALGAQKASAT